jgi:hypothetical protein
MPTKSPRRKQDRKRVSSQKHEIGYTGRKVAKKTGSTVRAGKKAVKKAKRQTGTVSRGKVERRASALVGA